MQILDGYLIKYGASVVALLVYAAPLYARRGGPRQDQGDVTQDYIRAMRLLQNTSRCRAPRPLLAIGTIARLIESARSARENLIIATLAPCAIEQPSDCRNRNQHLSSQ